MQVGKNAKLNVESTYLNGTEGHDDLVDGGSFGKEWALLYGVRVFGDTSFIAPIGPDVGEFHAVLPPGLPSINIGSMF